MMFRPVNQESLGQNDILCQKAYRLLLGLLQACDVMPSSLLIGEITLLEDNAVFHGVYADVFKGLKDGQELALKRPRMYIGHDHQETRQVLLF